MSAVLTLPERSDLARLEATINAGLRTFVEVGAALAEIRDRKLYRAEFETFEAYAQGRWKMTSRRAYQLIEASVVVENVNNCSHATPATESQARPLVGLPREEQREVWAEAVREKGGGQPTARDVERARERISPRHENPEDVAAQLVRTAVAKAPDPRAAVTADGTPLPPARRAPRKINHFLTDLVATVTAMGDVTDEEIAGLDTNDLMLARLRAGRAVLDRILAYHNREE